MTVRVRFAPSPTGYLHIGSARTALYNFLFARHEKGTFVLRIEDTDRQRSTEASTRTILDGMKWLGLAHDEGPFLQSERIGRHREAAEQLEKAGKAYWQEDPDKGRALYFRIPRDRKIDFEDRVLGRITLDPASDAAFQRDLVLVKSDGSPTYNFACVVDDHDMQITHVIRGQDHISNTPKQVLLYRALGVEPPAFAHIPLIHDPKGAKISKRRDYDFPVTVGEVIEMGYLPHPFVNFLALLGWSPGDDREIMSMTEMIEAFTLDRVNKSPARFLRDKLDHMNGVEIRARSVEELAELCRPHLEKAYDLSGIPTETLHAAVRQQHPRLRTLSEIVEKTKFVFTREVEFNERALDKALRRHDGFAVLEDVRAVLAGMNGFSPEEIEKALRDIAERRDVKFKFVAQPIRVAMTGDIVSPPIHETVSILGRERAIARIEAALRQR